MTDWETAQTRIREYREKLAEASAKWGGVEICAVTKTVEAETANSAYEAGIRIIGENRVQEIVRKFPALNPGYSIHLIGQLQTNKVKYIMSCVDMIQSLDRIALADELNRQALKVGRVIPALVQVNIAREAQKSGIDEEELLPFLKKVADLPGISVRGLMAIMPRADDVSTLRPFFRRMRVWFDRLRESPVPGIQMETLSMGMSRDCMIAAEEGATMVRLGTAIFGARDT